MAIYIDPNLIIAQLKFLEKLDRDDVVHILTEAAQPMTLEPFRPVYRQDSRVTTVYLLLEGTVWQERRDRTVQPPRRSLAREVGPGALLGIYEFLFDSVYQTQTTTRTPCLVYAIDAAALSRLIFRFPTVREDLANLKLIGRLRTFPLLSKVSLVGLGFLSELIKKPLDYDKGAVLYRSGASEERLFLIDAGQVEARWDDGETHWLANGAVCGLLRSSGWNLGVADRTMDHTATVQTKTQLLGLPYAAFTAIADIDPDHAGMAEIQHRERILENLALFGSFSANQLHRLAGHVSHYYFPYNYLLIQQNEEADSFWVLLEDSGALIRAVDDKGQTMLTTTAVGLTYFGENSLLGQTVYDSTVEAAAHSQWLRMYWHDFELMDADDPADLRALLQITASHRQKVVPKDERRKYPWLQVGELLVFFSRRHPIVFFIKNLPTFIFGAISVVFLFVSMTLPGEQRWLIIPAAFLLLLTIGALIWGTLDYLNDWIIVTNRRIVHQEKVLFVNVWRKEAPVDQVQKVDFQTTWLGKWLNYGTMNVQTAATFGNISFDYTMHFRKLNAAITEQRTQRRQQSIAESKTKIHRQLERRLMLDLGLPKRVLTGDAPVKPPTGWNGFFHRRLNRRLEERTSDQVVWRKHWVVLIPKLWWALLILLIMITLTILPGLRAALGLPESWQDASNIAEFVFGVLTFISFLRVVWVIADWHNDTYVVTNDQIIHIDRMPFGISENRKSANLSKIQNVSMAIPSTLHWLLNFGNVVCQTAAESGAFVFFAVSDPRAVSVEIQARIQHLKQLEEIENAKRRTQDLPDWFEMYDRLDKSGVDGRSNPSPVQPQL